MMVYEYICTNMERTTRTRQSLSKNNKKLIELPYPYTSPCIDGKFQELYYWDTYFTNKAFFQMGNLDQAVNNVRNFAYLLDVYGKVPNGNRTDFLNRSQPPFLGCMLDDLMSIENSPISVGEAYGVLEKEYAFWMTERVCDNGLNRYWCDLSDKELMKKKLVNGYRKRTGIMLDYSVENARNVLAECESGWDFSPRFSGKCTQYNPVDLNCLLYRNEILLSDWAQMLDKQNRAEFYRKAAAKRKEKIQTLMLSDGMYFDYDYVNDERSDIVSCAALFPFFVGIDCDKMRFERILGKLEEPLGLVACRFGKGRFQWCEPNSWAPLNYIAFASAKRLCLFQTAKRIAAKYVAAVDRLFARTGQLWEKYDAADGSIDTRSEYGTPAMLGWSAGVYAEFYRYLKEC